MRFLRKVNCFWHCKTVTSYSKLNEWFKESDIFNKAIKAIITTDDIAYLNRGHFINIYNNRLENSGAIIRYKDCFDISFIDKNSYISRYVPNKGVVIIIFEDNTTFEFWSPEYAVFHLAENKLNKIIDNPPNVNMDIQKMFSVVYGQKITGFELKLYNKNWQEFKYVKKWKAPKEQVFSIKLKLTNGKYLFMKFQNFFLSDDGNYPESMQFSEYLDCVCDIEKCLRK